MNFTETEVLNKANITVRNLLPEMGIDRMRNEIILGITANKKSISSKYFYNDYGSKLFEKITKLNEYYPTRTEKNILKDIAPNLMNGIAKEIIELGSGDCSKISILFEANESNSLENFTYIPVDVSESAINNSATDLTGLFPHLHIKGYVADFMHQMNEIPHSEKKRLICFFGSTIGNFSLKQAGQIVLSLRKNIEPGDELLIGFDMVKPEPVLNAAYNDAQGITSAFNKNILDSVNSIIDSNFKQENFDHIAFYNREKSRIEMHLEANKEFEVSSAFMPNAIRFKKGDRIHTENSHKYTMEQIRKLAFDNGLKIAEIYTDSKKWFALVKFEIDS